MKVKQIYFIKAIVISVAILSAVFYSPCLFAGVFIGTAVCTPSADCGPLAVVSSPENLVTPFGITHPPGYDGSGGNLQYRICILPGSEALAGPLSRAISTWNQLVATTENCEGCKVWEEEGGSPQTVHAETTLLHELGHCPLGLAHPDRNWDAQVPPDGIWEPTSFTRSVGVALPPDGIKVGGDFLRGTLDDIQIGPGSIPNNVHWFRVTDNNPAVVDSTIIDINTYSPSTTLHLPSGHSWAANGNRRANETLGFTNTQTVMYGVQSDLERTASLTADDVNMIKMGMVGQDLLSGANDDYTIELVLAEQCSGSIDVFVTFADTAPGELARCDSTTVDYSFAQNPFLARHFTLSPVGDAFVIILDQTLDWMTDDDEFEVFVDSFESGDLTGWSSVVQ